MMEQKRKCGQQLAKSDFIVFGIIFFVDFGFPIFGV